MSYAIHKFRSTLGKFRAVRPNELVLLAYSGGLSSGSMVKLVHQGLEEAGAQKRMVFKPSVLYIDGKIL
jgi:cytoplasmic tRNA 2-thiolation protein 2